MSMVLQLPRSGLYMGIVLPQARQGIFEFLGFFVVAIGNIFVIFGFEGVDGIVFVIFGFVVEMP